MVNTLQLKNPNEVVIRMYGQGFGDCFLLALPRDGEGNTSPVYVVIDCGVFYTTPKRKKRMAAVVENILSDTGGEVDLLVITHEHYDHLSGFDLAKEAWKEINVKHIWLGWTEDENNEFTKAYDREKEALAVNVDQALQIAEKISLNGESLLPSKLQQLNSILSFDMGFEANEEGEAPFKAPRRLSKTTDRILDDFVVDLTRRFANTDRFTPTFCSPSQVHRVPGSAVDAYVLGPPTDPDYLGLDFRSSSVYHLAIDEDGQPSSPIYDLEAEKTRTMLATYAEDLDEDALPGQLGNDVPFNQRLCKSLKEAQSIDFFQKHYFSAEPHRRIDYDWLGGAGRLALQLDRLTNNTSLVLAFRLPDDRYLLFVGDAQVGNWLSWHEIKPEDWNRKGGDAILARPTAEEILNKTAVYKVGHHGSHNATLKENGLEMMTSEPIAFVPTSRKIPQIYSDPAWPIPLKGLVTRLKEVTSNQVIFPHQAPSSLQNGAEIEFAQEKLPEMRRDGRRIESTVPLWRQVRI